MRRSLDFGTLTGNLSTLKSSRSNGNSNDSNNGGTINGTTHSASPSGSRFGTIAGLPTSEAGNLANDHVRRPRSALSNGRERTTRNGGGRRAFALGSLFNMASSEEQQQNAERSSDTGKAAPLRATESATEVHHHSSLAPTNAPPTPDTPAEREHALMLAVQAAKAKDQAWQIVVQPAPSEGLFLEHANARSNKLGKVPRRRSAVDQGASPPTSTNAMFGGFSGRARRLLGMAGDRSTTVMPGLSTTFEEVVESGTRDVIDSPEQPPSLPQQPASESVTRDCSNGAVENPATPASPAKRPLDISEDDISSPPAAITSAPAAEDGNDAQPSTSTPAPYSATSLLPASLNAGQLLVLYVTTGSSSLTLYRTVQQLFKLDEELRTHYSANMPSTPRPSVLSSHTGKVVTSPTPSHGHTRRKSVLASLTRTFTSPTLSRIKVRPNVQSSASQDSIAEEESGSAGIASLTSPSIPHTSNMTSSFEEQPLPQSPVLASQLSNLSDYLSSLSSIAVIRTSRQWATFFKPGKEDHESSRLEPLPQPSIAGTKGKRVKRMKSEGGLETRSPMSSPPDLMLSMRHGLLTSTPERKEVRIDDSGVYVDSLGHYTSRHGERGHPTESSTNSSSATSNSASTHMKRIASNGTDTSVSSAMSHFIEHTEDIDENVGDPEVLAYMERLRQESEARAANTKIPLAMSVTPTRNEGKSSKSTIAERATSTPYSPEFDTGQDLDHTPPALLPDSLQPETAMPTVKSASDDPTLSALEESESAAIPSGEAEEAQLPPLSGATIVASEESPLQLISDSMSSENEPEGQVNTALLSPEIATVETPDMQSTASSSLAGKEKKSNSSLRRRRKSSTANTSITRHTRSHKQSIRIEDFEILRVLGKGCAGKVLLARLKDMTSMSTAGKDTSLYAIKAIHKHHVLAHRELAHTLTEQSILRKMATDTPNPFVVKMRWSFQDNDNLFLVLDFHSGGDLATQLSRWGRLGKDRTRFYAAEIIEGLESLHNAGIIYRDLKPENILLAADGHVVLTDFGLSKQFHRPSTNGENGSTSDPVTPTWMKKAKKDSKSRQTSPVIGTFTETTTTFCGTAEYLAPEVLLGHAYSYPVDMWSLGTMIYEMLLGVTPFYNEDHGVMYRKVLHEQLDFGSSDYLDGDTRALLRGLLQKEPEFRMTTSRVKRSKYFEAIDWEFVNSKRYIPPFIPNLSPDDPADTQNFEECFLTMDLGFVDPKDTEEIEMKVKASGKEPDKAFDEEGRDVFADYSFDGAWADPESEEEGNQSESDDTISEEEEEEVDEGEERSGNVNADGESDSDVKGPAQMDPCSSVEESTANGDDDAHDSSNHASQQDYGDIQEREAAVGPDEDRASASHENRPPRLIVSNGEPSSVVSEIQSEENYRDEAKTSNEPLPASLNELGLRNSVEMPRMGSPAQMSDDGLPRMSGEHEDWDVVETLDNSQSADNGPKGPRKRLIAGTNLFAKGVVDKYKLQLKPLSRIPTPTRSYTARSPINRLASGTIAPSRSTKTSNQLSPSPSIGGMSESPSSVESSERAPDGEKKTSKGPARRLVTPRLLRASSDWMSSSLPASPTPRFRMRRNKKGTAPEATSPSFDKEKAPLSDLSENVSAAPGSSLDSNATLPLEQAGNFGLQPLTRQVSNERSRPIGEDQSSRM